MQDFLKTDALFFLSEYQKIIDRGIITFFPETEVKVINLSPLTICDGGHYCRAKLEALKDSIVTMPDLGKYIFLKKWSFFINLRKNSHELDFYVRIIEYATLENPKRELNEQKLESILNEEIIRKELFLIKKRLLQEAFLKTNFSIPNLSEIIAKNSKKTETHENPLLESYSHENLLIDNSQKRKILLYISKDSVQLINSNKEEPLLGKNIFNLSNFPNKMNDNMKFNHFMNRLKEEKNKRLSANQNKALINPSKTIEYNKKRTFSEFNNQLTKEFKNLTLSKKNTREKSNNTKKMNKTFAFKNNITTLRPPDEFFEKVKKKTERLINQDNSLYKLQYLKIKKREQKKKFRPIENNFIRERKKLITPKALNQIKCENKKMASMIQERKSDILMEENPICIEKLNKNFPSKAKEKLNNSECIIFDKFKHDLSLRKNDNSNDLIKGIKNKEAFQSLTFFQNERTARKNLRKFSKFVEDKQNKILDIDHPFSPSFNIDVQKIDDTSKIFRKDNVHSRPKVIVLADENQIQKKNKTSKDSKKILKEFFNDFNENYSKKKVIDSPIPKDVKVIILNEECSKNSSLNNSAQRDELLIDDSSNLSFAEIDFSNNSPNNEIYPEFSVQIAAPEPIKNSPCVMFNNYENNVSSEKSKSFRLENYLYSNNIISNQIIIHSDEEENNQYLNEISFGEKPSKRRKLNFQLETLNLFKQRDFNYK